jgi:hypothetical protein
MDRRRVAVMALAIAIVLAGPRKTSAGFIDFIYEMSGPQLVGIGPTCRIGLGPGERPRCSFFGAIEAFEPRVDPTRTPPRARLSSDFGYFTADGADVNGSYRFNEVKMIGIEPIVEVRTGQLGTFTFHHGAGVTFHHFRGDTFDSFWRKGLKFRVVSFEVPLGDRVTLGGAYNVRYYANRVEAGDFELVKPPDADRPGEVIWKAASFTLFLR